MSENYFRHSKSSRRVWLHISIIVGREYQICETAKVVADTTLYSNYIYIIHTNMYHKSCKAITT